MPPDTNPSDALPVRSGEELNTEALSGYLNAPIEVLQFPAGHSNLVYLIRTPQMEYVLRRPPLGPLAPKAHDMAREYRVLKAVHPYFPEAPQPFLYCDDDSVIGTPFFLMERRHGVILRDTAPANPQHVSEAFIDCLIRLHAIDISSAPLNTVGKPEGFLDRQLKGWADRWYKSQTHPLPAMQATIGWLNDNLPTQQPPALIHNDYKLDNIMLSADEGRIEAVLDWEMATLGDPIADLGLTLCYWTQPSTSPLNLTASEGWYTREQIIERYAQKTGRDVASIVWYEVLGIFKLSVILQQIYFRFHRGQTRDERFRHFNKRVAVLIDTAIAKQEQA